MLSSVELTEARRHLGYPAHGLAGAIDGWQYSRVDGVVEHRLVHLSDAEEGVVRQYLGTLNVLERAIPEMGVSLDTNAAAGWVRNPDELEDRGRLFDEWRRRFCAFVGVAPGPGLVKASTAVRLVV